jgi:hypothetical protein
MEESNVGTSKNTAYESGEVDFSDDFAFLDVLEAQKIRLKESLK